MAMPITRDAVFFSYGGKEPTDEHEDNIKALGRQMTFGNLRTLYTEDVSHVGCTHSPVCKHYSPVLVGMKGSLTWRATPKVYFPGLPEGVNFDLFCKVVHVLDKHANDFFYGTYRGLPCDRKYRLKSLGRDGWLGADVHECPIGNCSKHVYTPNATVSQICMHQILKLSGMDITSFGFAFDSEVAHINAPVMHPKERYYYSPLDHTIHFNVHVHLHARPKRLRAQVTTRLPGEYLDFKMNSVSVLCYNLGPFYGFNLSAAYEKFSETLRKEKKKHDTHLGLIRAFTGLRDGTRHKRHKELLEGVKTKAREREARMLAKIDELFAS